MYHKTFGQMISDERGFTLVELLVVIAITGFLAGAMALTFSTVSNINASTTENYMVMSQVQIAGNTIAKDIASSCNITTGSGGNWHCSMNRYTWYGGDNVTTIPVDFIITDGVLTRRVNGIDGMRVAEYISAPGTDTTFMPATENNTYLLTIKAVYGGTSFSSIYKVVCKSP